MSDLAGVKPVDDAQHQQPRKHYRDQPAVAATLISDLTWGKGDGIPCVCVHPPRPPRSACGHPGPAALQHATARSACNCNGRNRDHAQTPPRSACNCRHHHRDQTQTPPRSACGVAGGLRARMFTPRGDFDHGRVLITPKGQSSRHEQPQSILTTPNPTVDGSNFEQWSTPPPPQRTPTAPGPGRTFGR